MNKIYTSVIASILLLFCFFSAQAFTPTLSTSRLDTGTIHPCDTIHNQVIVRDTSSTSHQDTLFIYLNANVLNFTAYSLSGSLPVFYSAGIAKIYIDTAIDTIINYSYYIPCSIIPSSNTPTAINCNEIIRYVHVHAGINFYSSSYILNIPFGYYNLFYNPTPTVPSNFSIAGRIGQRLVRTITLNSTGLNSTGFDGYLSLTDSISNACDMYVIDSLIVDRVNSFGIRNNITTNYYSTPVIPSNTPFYYSPFIHLNALSNEHLEIREVIHIQAAGSNTCIDNCLRHQIENKFEINYGCDTLLLCKNISLNATIYKTSNTLSLADSIISSVMNWDTACFQNPLFSSLPTTSQLIHHTHFVKNKGNSIAYQVQLILTSKNKTSEVILPYWTSTNYRSSTIAADSIQYYYPSLTSAANLPTCINSFRNLIPLNETDSCSPINEISWTFPELTVGEIVQIDYYTYRCCPNDTDKYVGNFTAATYYDTWNLNGHLDGIDQDNHAAARDECGFTIYLEQASKYGIVKTEMLTGSILGPAHLTGTNGICDTTKTVYYEIPLSQFCDGVSTARNEDLLAALSGGSLQGQLLVDISTDYGLNPIPMGSRLINLESSIATGSITRVANLLGAGSYSGAGGNIQVSFNLDTLHADTSLSTYANLVSFINGAYFRFPITPCCNGLAKPLINVKFYIVPKLGSNTCYYCKIPLSAKTRAIELHCPGCVTPGIIADNCKVRRITTGYPDNNNNGLADMGTPYAHIDSIHLNRYAGSSFMPGDEISLYLEGYGQDGDNNGGFDYATLQDYWDSLHSVHPSYPVGFTYVYILIKNACAASSSFNWQVLSDTFYLHRGNVDTSFSLHPFETSTGHYHLYRVPVSSLFDTLSMNDRYKVKIKYKACANGSPTTCNISSYMWWSATSLHDSLTQINYPIIGDTIDFYKDSVLIQRIEHADTAFVYQCEAHGDQINAFALKKEIKYVWKNSAHPDFPTSTTCDKMLTTNYKLRLISEVANQVNLFPYEYRPLQPDFIYDITERPSGLAPTYIVSNINTNSIYKNWLAGTTQITNSLVGSNSVAGLYNYYQLATTKNIVVETSLPAATSPYFVQGDEQNEININYTYSPTVCATPDSTIAIKENTNKAVVKSTYCADVFDTAQNIDNATIFLRNPNPTLILNLVRTTVDVYSVDPTCFAVQFRNGNSREHLAENVWLHIVNPSAGGHIWSVSELSSSAGVNIDSVRSDGDSGLIAYINHLNSNQSIDLQICFDVNSCIRPSNIQLIYGYSCVDSIACFIDSTQIQLQIAEALILPIAAHLPDTMTTCIADTIDASFEVQEAGEIDHLTVGVNLPVGVNIQAAILSYSRLADTPIVSAALGFVRVDTIIAGRQYIRFLLAADTVLHGPNSSEYSSIWIHIRFIIGSCISSSFSPTIYLQGQSYCNGIETDSITNGMIHVIYSADSCLPVSVVLDSINHTTCNGSREGYLSLENINNGNITYLWNTGDTGIFIDSLITGSYSVTATDEYGCSSTASFTINAGRLKLPGINHPYTTCDSTLSFSIDSSYDTSRYDYSWNSYTLILDYDSGIYKYDTTFYNSGIITNSNFNVYVYGGYNSSGAFSHPAIVTIFIYDKLLGCIDSISIMLYKCCTEHPYGTVLNGKVTDITLPGGANRNCSVDGVLYINTNTTIDNVYWRMNAYSEIIVDPAVTFTILNSKLYACDTIMWKGITLLNGAKLVVENSFIADAITAITSVDGAEFNIISSFLNRNKTNINVESFSGTHLGFIDDSRFYCNNDFMSGIVSYYSPIVGTLLFPFKNLPSSFGININNVNAINIGTCGGVGNTFEDMITGVRSFNSNCTIINNFFNKIKNTSIVMEGSNDLLSSSIIPVVGNAICANIIDQSTTGISVQGINAQIENNQIRNVHIGIGIYNTISSGFMLPGTTPYTFNINILNNSIQNISGNFIVDYGYGIRMNNCDFTNANINNNTIDNPIIAGILSPYKYTYGIHINKTSSSAFTSTPIVMSQNNIRSMRFGVYLNNARNARIMDNTIQMQSDNNTLYGICLTGCRTNWIQCNDISEPSFVTVAPALSNNRSAIELRSSTNSIISTNAFTNSPVGLSVRGNCSMPNRLAGNIFDNHYYHIVLNNAGRIDGQQNIGSTLPLPTTPDNQFLPTVLPVGRFKIVTANSTDGSLSPFDVSNFPPWMNPAPLTSISGSSTIPLNYLLFFNSFAPSTCSSPLPLPRLANPDEIDTDENTAYKEYGNTTLDELLYEDKKNLYLKLLEDSIYSDSLRAFKADYENSDEYQVLLAKEKVDKGDKEGAKDDIDEIDITPIPAILMKEIIKYQSDTIEIDSNNIHWNRICEIASICPWLGGEAVYIAQGIVMSNSDINEWDDYNTCGTGTEPSGARKMNQNATEIFNRKVEEVKLKIIENSIVIYPNPTNEFIYINSNNTNIKKYIIRDITCRTILESNYVSNKINVVFLTDGIYILELIDSNNISEKIKFIKHEK